MLAGGKYLSSLTVSWEDFFRLQVGLRTDSSGHIGPNPLKQHEGEEAEHFVNGTYVFFSLCSQPGMLRESLYNFTTAGVLNILKIFVRIGS